MKRTLLGLLAFGLFFTTASQAQAADPVYTGYFSSKAVSGYDTVAYFREGRPVAGSSEHAYEWMGATWLFASAESKQLFIDAPEQYAPQYGGYCAWAVSQGSTASADPTAWKIVDGKLYLNYNHAIQVKWLADVPGNITRADENWPRILAD